MDFRLGRLGIGEWGIGLCSLAMIINVFALPWYGIKHEFSVTLRSLGAQVDANGWQSLSVLAPFTLALAALGLVIWWTAATRRAPALPASLSALELGLSLVLVIWTLVRTVLAVPGIELGGSGSGDAIEARVGAYVALVLALLLLTSCYRSLRREGIASGDAPRVIETRTLS